MTVREQIFRDEGGLRLLPYMDCCRRPRLACRCEKPGSLTVGVGHNLDAKPLARRVLDLQYDVDLADAVADVARVLPWALELDPGRRGVLEALVFNMGIGSLISKNPKMLAALKAGEHAAAKRELLDGPYKIQVGPRAFRLAEQLLTGEIQ